MTKRALLTLLALVAIVGGAWLLLRGDADVGPTTNDGNGSKNGGQDSGDNGDPNGSGVTITDMVKVTSPLRNVLVTSPLTVTGEARGNWYFEASFPIRVVDANGRQLGISHAQAEGEWMTTNFVPFRGTITFIQPTTTTGFLILEKDNPSGLPENDAEVRVPIRFNASSATMRTVKIYQYDESRDKDASGNVRCSAQGLVAMDKQIPFTNTPIQDAVRELLKSDSDFSGVTLTSASLSGGVLTLTFNDPQGKTSGGSCKVSVLRAQVETTAKQFGGVTSVRYAPSSVFEP